VLLIVSAITFSLLSAAGGDALTLLSSNPVTSQQTLVRLRQTYGLDRPLYLRYANWLRNIARGDMGQSSYHDAPVWTVLKPRLFATTKVAVVALGLALLFAFAMGTGAARWPGGWLDYLSSGLVIVASSLPRIVIALVALVIIAQTALFSLSGTDTSGPQSLRRLLVTGSVLSVPLFALFLGQIQDGLKETMQADFITVARAKGLSETRLLLHHAMRNSLNPVINIAGYALGGLISGSVIVESVLGWPGLGQICVTAVRSRDVPLLMGLVLVTASFVLAGNFIADVLLFLTDPQMRARAEFKSTFPGKPVSAIDTAAKG